MNAVHRVSWRSPRIKIARALSKRRTKPGGGRPRVLIAVTADESILLLRGFPGYLTEAGWEVHVVSSPGPRSSRLSLDTRIGVHSIAMRRELALLDDCLALGKWIQLLVSLRPDVVCVGTPKAGLIGGFAAMVTGVPNRIFLLRGLRSEGLSGLSGLLMRVAERVSALCAHSVVCVSPSLRSAAVQAQVVADGRAVVLGTGSSNGVSSDIKPAGTIQRSDARHSWFVKPELFTVGFVGRITRDKGLDTLAAALSWLTTIGVVGNCLIIGGDDSSDSDRLRSALDCSGWAVVHTGHVENALEMLSMVDALCLPSRREGFPNVVLEAAMLGLPTIGSDATGMQDAVVDEVTGLTFPAEDAGALASAIGRLYADNGFCDRLGTQARERAVREFTREVVWARYESYFRRLMRENFPNET